MSSKYYIPNTLENWKWPCRLNPHHLEVKAASAVWLRSFETFSPRAQYAFDRCDFGLIASLAYPSFSKERLRTVCDLMNLAFLYDAHSDVAREDDVRVMADISMDALRNPHTPRPKDEWIGGEITRQFWECAIKTTSPGSQKHFIKAYDAYTQAVVQEAADRTHKHIRTMDEYMEVRRLTIGAMPFFAMLGMGLNLPDEAVLHPVIEELSALAADIISLTNDMISYNIEQARGDDNHKAITIVMHHNKTDVQGAMDWVSNYCKSLVAKFMDLYENEIPKFGEPVDTELAQYVDGLGNWVRANDQWHFESERYFGKKGPEIQKTRWVTLLPKKPLEEVGPELVDGSMM